MKRTMLLTALISAMSANTFAATPVEEFIAFENQVAQEMQAWHDFFKNAHTEKMNIVKDTKENTFKLRKNLDSDLQGAKNEADIQAAYAKALTQAKELYAKENKAWQNWFAKFEEKAQDLAQKYDEHVAASQELSTQNSPTALEKAKQLFTNNHHIVPNAHKA